MHSMACLWQLLHVKGGENDGFSQQRADRWAATPVFRRDPSSKMGGLAYRLPGPALRRDSDRGCSSKPFLVPPRYSLKGGSTTLHALDCAFASRWSAGVAEIAIPCPPRLQYRHTKYSACALPPEGDRSDTKEQRDGWPRSDHRG